MEATSDPTVVKNRPEVHPYGTLDDNESSKSAGKRISSEMPLVDLERRG